MTAQRDLAVTSAGFSQEIAFSMPRAAYKLAFYVNWNGARKALSDGEEANV